MTIEETISFFKRKFSKIPQRVAYDIDERGEDFCEIFFPNEINKNLPISILVNDLGCLLSVGRLQNVMGDRPISPEACEAAIRDVIEDKIVFVFGYKSDDDFDESKVFFSRFFALTGREDDMSEEYEKFLLTLEKKPSWLERKFSKTVGIFEFFTFSQAKTKIIKRL